MAISVVSNVASRLGDLVVEEAKFLWDVKEQVEGVETQLRWMKAFLTVAESKQVEDDTVREWVADIRDIAYDAEDVIETFGLKIASRRHGGISNTIKRYSCILKEAWMLHKVKSEIEGIKSKMATLIANLQACRPREIHAGESTSSSSSSSKRQSYSHIVESNVLGFDVQANNLVAALQYDFRPVVSICGMGGLGKTTLAKKVFHDSRVKSHFYYRFWVYVSQQCQSRTVWKAILSGGDKNRQSWDVRGAGCRGGMLNSEEDNQQLAQRIFDMLKMWRCLVVLDDIWRADDWDAIKPAFPIEESITGNTAGSKILLTSRTLDVALHIGKAKCLIHELCPLSPQDSFTLLRNVVHSTNYNSGNQIDQEMENLAADMVHECAGLPLAIVVLGGILARKCSLKEWQKVHENVKSYLSRSSACQGALSLSYENLPAYLKPCLLYLSIFPYYELSAQQLIELWVAEDLVSPEQGESGGEEMVEDVAERYLNELAERYMIQVGFRDQGSNIMSCRLHDLVRDLCQSKAKQENFHYVIDPFKMELQTGSVSRTLPSDATGKKVRRLGVHKSVLIKKIYNPHLRSVLLFDDVVRQEFPLFRSAIISAVAQNSRLYGREDSFSSRFAMGRLLCQMKNQTKGLVAYIINNFKLLRVLDFGPFFLIGNKSLTNIGSLIHLRYLRLGPCFMSRLPSSLGKLRCLIALDLRISGVMAVAVHVPNVLWRLQRLRHLYLPEICHRKTKLKLDTLTSLKTLVNFNTENCYLRDLCCMTTLRRLLINMPFTVNQEDLNLDHPIITSNHLQVLGVAPSTETEPETAIDARYLTYLLSFCHSIYKLNLGVEIRMAPQPQPIATILWPIYSNVASISLSGSKLYEDPMPTLGKLPKLRVLQLDADAFIGRVMICSFFPVLEDLSISSLTNLEELVVYGGIMLYLRRLIISNCRNLRELPNQLAFIRGLDEVRIHMMPRAFGDRLMGQDYWKVKHVRALILQNWDY